MTQALVVSVVALWILVLVLAGVVFALARQVGVLHERIAPAGALALSDGPKVGEAAPAVAAESLDGRIARIGAADPDGRARLLFFLSPRCPVCKRLLPTVQRIARERGAKLVIASDGPEEDHAGLARAHDLAAADYYLSAELGVRYGIAKLPYAILMDGGGLVRGQGIVNTREHVESLFEAERMRVASIQDYLSGAESASAERPRQGNDA